MTLHPSRKCGSHESYTSKCKACVKAWHANYRLENKEKRAAQCKASYMKKREEYLAKSKAYLKTDKSKQYHREYARRKANSDPLFKLKRNLRVRLYTAIKLGYKSGSAIQDLGCSIEEFKTHLEQQFEPGMSWSNYGDWEIDHRLPLSSFDLSRREELLKACHYSNLQPMWKFANRQKSDRNYDMSN